MRHHNKNRKFGRPRNQRKALIASLAISLIDKERIKTTLAKAKELRPFIEPMVTRAKNGSLENRRLIASRLLNQKIEIKKLFDVISPKYTDRKGGYTRIIKMPRRLSDASPMAIIEFV